MTRIIGYYRIDESHVQSLHATKGYRKIENMTATHDANDVPGAFTRFGKRKPARPMTYKFPTEKARLASLERHGWYCRQMRKDAA
jgi:hypothetical protein